MSLPGRQTLISASSRSNSANTASNAASAAASSAVHAVSRSSDPMAGRARSTRCGAGRERPRISRHAKPMAAIGRAAYERSVCGAIASLRSHDPAAASAAASRTRRESDLAIRAATGRIAGNRSAIHHANSANGRSWPPSRARDPSINRNRSASRCGIIASETPDTVARTIRSIRRHCWTPSCACLGIFTDTDSMAARSARESRARARTDRTDRDPGWARPNEKMPVEDIQILGTHTPATPTYQAPRGASLDAYLDSAEQVTARRPTARSPRASTRWPKSNACSGDSAADVRVVLPRAADGRSYAPLTLRRLADGKQIGIHHDYHYPLDLYSELKSEVDTRTLVSWVVTLRKPTTGGELVRLRGDAGHAERAEDAERLPVGPREDRAAVRRRQLHDGSRWAILVLLASGRCLSSRQPHRRPASRVTMGGFLAMGKDRSRPCSVLELTDCDTVQF